MKNLLQHTDFFSPRFVKFCAVGVANALMDFVCYSGLLWFAFSRISPVAETARRLSLPMKTLACRVAQYRRDKEAFTPNPALENKKRNSPG